jgi:hypothetical protein
MLQRLLRLMKKVGASLISEERQRQISDEGFTPEHDACLTNGELIRAARCYEAAATSTLLAGRVHPRMPNDWPFTSDRWNPEGDAVRLFVKAGALFKAELDRLDRAGTSGIVQYTDCLLGIKRCASHIDDLASCEPSPASQWQIGCRLLGTVHEVYPGQDPHEPLLTFVVAEGEGILMMGVRHIIPPSVGMTVEIELVEGTNGPNWRICDIVPAEAA